MKKLLFLIISLGSVQASYAQPHFRFTETDLNHSLQIESAILDDRALGDGNEIGTFTAGGLCAGAVEWQSDGVELLAWRDDPDTEAIDGFQNDEEFAFRIWDVEAGEEVVAIAEFTRWDEVFRARGHSQLNLHAERNLAPELSEVGDHEIAEGDELSFELTASDPDNDELTFSGENLPEGATIDGSDFSWTPSFDQAGSYEVTFRVSDGVMSDEETVTITVNNVNRAPVWSIIPPEEEISGYVDESLQVEVAALDPDGDNVEYGYRYLNNPESTPDASLEIIGDRARFSINPNRFEFGQYEVLLTASDGEFSIESVARFEVRVDHFRFAETGRRHTIRIQTLGFAFGDHDGLPDLLDEIGVVTPGGLVAGAHRFGEDEEAPWTLAAWGDIQNVQGIEGFRNNEEIRFFYWDYSAGEEFDVSAHLIAGDETWRLEGFSIYNLSIGPDLSADSEMLDFGFLRTDTVLERIIRITSVGSTPVEGVRAVVEGAGFSVIPENQFDLAVGESIELTISFRPEFHELYQTHLIVGNELATVQIDLTGFGITQNHFAFPVTNIKKTIRVVQADLDGEALSEGDEIGVLTPDDLIAGSLIALEGGSRNIFAWGDDPETREADGFEEGDVIHFKIWDADADTEYPAFATYLEGDEDWTENGFAAVSLTTRSGHFHPNVTEIAHHIVVNSVNFFNGSLSDGDEIAVITNRNIPAGSVTVVGDPSWEFDAYGDDPATEDVMEGFELGSLLYFRIWDREEEREVFADASFVEGPNRFEDGGNTVVELVGVAENREPSWRQIQNQTVDEGARLEFNVSVTDQDSDPATISLVCANPPTEAEFTDNSDGTGTFVWTPDFRQAGVYDVRFFAFDGWTRISLDVRLTVDDANQPPELARIGDHSIDEGEQLSFLLSAEDPDGDRLTYRGQNLPFGASLDENLFRWTPNSDQAGEYQDVRFEVIDVGHPALSDFELITITVNNVNMRPEWEEIDPITRSEGQRISIGVDASDPDDDEITLNALNLPENAIFEDQGGGSGIFEWDTDFQSSGIYSPILIASDGNLNDTLRLLIIINNVNRQPILAPVGNQQVRIGHELELRLTASDSDQDEGENLTFFSNNLPPQASIENTGPGEARLIWRPTFRETGSYNNVRITVEDPSGGQDFEQIRMTAIFDDNDPPLIEEISPANRDIVRSNPPTISAIIRDELSIVEEIEFIFDNRRIENFSFDNETGEFFWTPNQAIDEGAHAFRIRAIDPANNRSDAIVRFGINSTAGDIIMDEAPLHTGRGRLHFNGRGEPFLNVQLYNNDELVREEVANGRGMFRFTLVQLTEGWNNFHVEGEDEYGNSASPAEFRIYFDITAPTIEITAPEELTSNPTPEIRATIDDGGGSGVNGENGIDLILDNERIDEFGFEGGELSHDVQQDLAEGSHFLTLNASDIIGNTPEHATSRNFFVDSRAPVVTENEQNLIDDEIDSLANRHPVFSIPLADPEPASGIDWESIRVTLDDNELNYIYDDFSGAIGYDFANDDPLDEGVHEIRITVPDFAGNELSTGGQFYIGDVEDQDGPFFVNLYPQGVVGAGLGPERFRRNPQDLAQVDTMSLAIGDIDAGVDFGTIRLSLNGHEFGEGVRLMEGGRIEAPLWFARNAEGRRQMPIEMPGVEEGLNFANAFGADNEGNENEEDWNFYYDNEQPTVPSLDAFENQFVNTSEITVTGTVGGDGAYDVEGYENQARVRIYRNDELVAEVETEYEQAFSIGGIGLVDGQNIIEATTMDAGDNESELSDPIEVFLDLTEPTILEFATEGGEFIADGTPTFAASLIDDESGIDADGITLTVDNTDVEVTFDAETGIATGSVANELQDGDHEATLVIHDRSGNETTAGYSFNLDTRAVIAPEFTLQPYTSENQIVIAGEGTVGQNVLVYLDNQLIESFSLPDSAQFEFVSTRDDLADTSYISLSSSNEAGIESEQSEPQMLIMDAQPPAFADFSPDNGSSIDADQVQEIVFTVTDTVTGVDIEGVELTMQGEALQFASEEIEFGYRISADVSNYQFGIDEQVLLSSVASDHSIPPNQRTRSWEFVTVLGQPPEVAFPDISFAEDDELQIYVFDYIIDTDNGGVDPTVTAELIEGGDNGEVSINENGYLTITPSYNFFGDLLLRVHAEDASGLEGADTAVVTVTPVNDHPVVAEIENATAIVGRQFTLQAEASDVDPGDTITFSDDFDFFTISPSGLIDFTPADEMRGLYNVIIFAADQTGSSDSTSFQLLIAWVNSEIEVVGALSDVEVAEDSEPVELADLDDIFQDPDGQELHYTMEFNDNSAGIEIDIDSDTHIPTLTPNADFFGEVGVRITADDFAGSEASIQFTVHVTPVNDLPRMNGFLPEEVVIDEDAERYLLTDLDTVFYDIENDQLSFTAEGADQLGIQISEDNLLSFLPAANWNGSESIVITVEDHGQQRRAPRRVDGGVEDVFLGSSSSPGFSQTHSPYRDEAVTVELIIEVRPINDPPMAIVEDPYRVEMEEDQAPFTLPITLSEMFADVDPGDQVSVSWEELNGPISLTFDDNNTHIVAVLTEENWFNDEYDYPITARDNSGSETELTLRFVVTPVNDPPVVSHAIEDQTREEDSGVWEIVDLDQIFSDPDGDQLHFEASGSEGLTFVIDNENRLFGQPEPNYSGESTVTISASDENGRRMSRSLRPIDRGVNAQTSHPARSLRSALAQVTPVRDESVDLEFQMVISPVNDPPTWVEYPGEELEVTGSDLIEFRVSAEDIDSENLNISVSMNDLPEEAGFEETGDGSGLFNWQTTEETSGQFAVGFSVSDGIVSADITVLIFVTPPRGIGGVEETEEQHTLIITSVSFDGEPVAEGWMIGVFTPETVLCGASYWNGNGINMAVWGADEVHQAYFHAGEAMSLLLWDPEADLEWNAEAIIEEGELIWQSGGETILAIESFSAKSLDVPLRSGWNLISINVTPIDERFWNGDPGPEIVPMLDHLRRPDGGEHHVMLMKNERGLFYVPSRGFNGIPYWNLSEGYQIRVDEAVTATWIGEPIDPQADIPITRGWNMIAYFPDYELIADRASGNYVISPIIDRVVIAKDGFGNFMIPSRGNFSNMPSWHEGAGYQINVSEDLVLNYPDERQQNAALISTPTINRHWNDVNLTGSNMSLLITGISGTNLSAPDQVAAFSSETGKLVGVGSVTDGQIGVAVWGDDPTTDNVDGLKEGEVFSLKLWDTDSEVESRLSLVKVEVGEGLVYATDALAIVEMQMEKDIPTAFYLGGVYPNPFNSSVQITYGLHEAGLVMLSIYDVSGKQVAVVLNDERPAGHHSITWNGESVVSGVYILSMQTSTAVATQKVVLMR